MFKRGLDMCSKSSGLTPNKGELFNPYEAEAAAQWAAFFEISVGTAAAKEETLRLSFKAAFKNLFLRSQVVWAVSALVQ